MSTTASTPLANSKPISPNRSDRSADCELDGVDVSASSANAVDVAMYVLVATPVEVTTHDPIATLAGVGAEDLVSTVDGGGRNGGVGV
jgi:hypothetical protein